MKATGFRTAGKGELYTGMRAHYHIHADPDLGVGKVAVQRIPCGCNTCWQGRHILVVLKDRRKNYFIQMCGF